MWKSHILTLLSPNVEWCKCLKLLRKFKMQISTQTDRENQKKCCNQWQLHSEKSGLKILKP